MNDPTIEDLKEIQARYPWMGDRHVVWLGPDEYRIARTNREREADIDLITCPLHQWLNHCSGSPHEIGTYVVSPIGPNEWDFWNLKYQQPHATEET